MHAGKPQKQALAIAYSVKRKSGKKKMAEGGSVKDEKRPMPEDTHNDAKDVSDNSARKPVDSDWSDASALKQSRSKGGMQPQKHPRMVEGILSTKLRDQEGRLIESMPPDSPKRQPDKSYDEKGPNRQGPDTPDLHMKKMAKGGKVMKPERYKTDQGTSAQGHAVRRANRSQDFSKHPSSSHPKIEREMAREDRATAKMRAYDRRKESRNIAGGPSKKPLEGLAEGGRINDLLSMHEAEEDRLEHPEGLESDNDQLRPDEDDYMSDHEQMLAEGGRADGQTDSWDDDGHEDSIAAAIMAKRDRMHDMIDSGALDEDHAVMAAEGGILSHDSIYSDDSDQVDLSRNADEDANEEDQLSFNALRKENYSESEGLRQLSQPGDSNEHGDSREDSSENKHDRVSAIRAKMKARKQFKG